MDMHKNGRFTHEHIGDIFGNEGFLIHAEKFDEYVSDLVNQLGDDWDHRLSYEDGYGNNEYAQIVEHRNDDIENGRIELPYNHDGYPSRKTHLFRIIGDEIEFVK